jgi:cold shock CspA family protein
MTKPLMKGVLKTWKEDRGFGFITPENGGRDVFIHISAIGEVARRPVPGDVIHYQITRDKHGKFRAINAYIEGLATQNRGQGRNANYKSSSLKLVLLTILALTLLAIAVFWYLQQGGFI